jgi:ABC-type transport system involved in multi-copper enzyme maturation permease subunit
VILTAAFRERLSVMNIVLLALIFVVVLLQIIIPFYLGSLVPGLVGSPKLANFYLPFASEVWFFFAVLLTASVGAGVIANDRATKSLTMYLARPITHTDYLAAKASAVALWVGMGIVLPPLVGTIIVLALGYVPLSLALSATGAFLGVGLLTVLALTAVAVLLSAWAPKGSYAAAAIFGVLAGAQIVALAIQGITGRSGVLYFSVDQDTQAVAQAAFGVSGGALDPVVSAGILGVIGVALILLAHRSLASVDTGVG